MADVAGIEMKKFIEFVLSLTILIIAIIEKEPATGSVQFHYIVICFCYLALLVLMTCMRRELGASTPLEAVFGVSLLIFGLLTLESSGFSPALRGLNAAFEIALGLMFIIFMLF